MKTQSGAQYSFVKAGTRAAIQFGRVAAVNTGREAAVQLTRSVEYLLGMPGPVVNTQYLLPSLTMVDGSCAPTLPVNACADLPAQKIDKSNNPIWLRKRRALLTAETLKPAIVKQGGNE